MINGLPTELLGSLVSNAASFVIGQVTESTSWKEWKSKNGLTERENNFLEVYVEAIIEFAQKDKPKFLLIESIILKPTLCLLFSLSGVGLPRPTNKSIFFNG
mgnify:CR=1 FL=1